MNILFDIMFAMWYIIFRKINNIFRKEVIICLRVINIDFTQTKNNKNIFQNVLDVYDSSIIVCFKIRLNITKKQNRN